jgi:hypothetical protein
LRRLLPLLVLATGLSLSQGSLRADETTTTTVTVRSDSPSRTSPKRFGLGLELGSPTSLSGKIWMDSVNAWDFAVGGGGYYSYWDGQERVTGFSGLVAHADYLWHHYGVFGGPGSDLGEKIPIYLGFGGVFATPGFVGVRAVLGLTYIFAEPFDLFLEVAPTLGLGQAVGYGGLDAGLGGRFYF